MTLTHEIDATKLNQFHHRDWTPSQRAYYSLRRAIISLDFPPGATLRKADVSKQLGISASPVTEAIARLKVEGLIDVVAQSGTYVTHLCFDELCEASFLRSLLEAGAVEKLAGDISQENLKRLERSLRMQALLIEDDDIEGFYEADEEFHSILMQSTGFGLLAKTTESASLHVSRARRVTLPNPGRICETLNEHRNIVEAIKTGDKVAARNAMQKHLGNFMSQLVQLVELRPELFKSPIR